MEAKIANSRTRDPINGRFTQVKVIRSQVVECKGNGGSVTAYVDLIIQVYGGPYYRVRMDMEAAAEIASDMANAERRARGDETAKQSALLLNKGAPE